MKKIALNENDDQTMKKVYNARLLLQSNSCLAKHQCIEILSYFFHSSVVDGSNHYF